MHDLRGKVAVVTGGGSGIGRAECLALAEAGMSVVVADVEADAAGSVAAEAVALGAEAEAVVVDVADRSSVDALAATAFERFGGVHVLCNNAGVFLMGPMLDTNAEDWEWILSVNVMGVVHGIHAFVPRLLAQGEPAHIVNTSSVVAFGGGGAHTGAYAMSKAAVLSMSESLHAELADKGIGVTALCPANISSRILAAQRNRPERFGRMAFEPLGRELEDFGLDPIHVGRAVVGAIANDDLYLFVYPAEWGRPIKPAAEKRFAQVLSAIDRGSVDA